MCRELNVYVFFIEFIYVEQADSKKTYEKTEKIVAGFKYLKRGLLRGIRKISQISLKRNFHKILYFKWIIHKILKFIFKTSQNFNFKAIYKILIWIKFS